MANLQQRPAQKSVLQLLEERRGDFLKVIPKHLNPDRLLRVAASIATRNPKLGACTPVSLLRAVMEASTLGLEPGVLGDGYLIPYGKEAQFQPGYQGLIKLAMQSKMVLSVNAGGVRRGDFFEFQQGSDVFVNHRINIDTFNPDELPYVFYCVMRPTGGEIQATIMPKAAVDRIRARSRAKDDGPWVTDYEQMGIKTAIKRALKYVPKSPQLAQALEMDDRHEMGETAHDVFPDLPDLPGEEAPPAKDIVAEAAEALKPKGTSVEDLEREFDEKHGS